MSSRETRRKRIRAKVRGTAKRPRLSVFRSNKKLYVQLIDDTKGTTLVASFGSNPEKVGEDLAKKARQQKIKTAVFDRGGYQYHGRVKILAEAVRKAGLKI